MSSFSSATSSDIESSEGPDAIALFRPKNRSMLEPFLDLDEGEESDGLYAEPLEDGSFLVHTFQPFEIFVAHPSEARAWLSQFGVALPEVHDDPRGLLFFSEDDEPEEAATYEAVVAEIGDRGLWVSLSDVVDDEEDAWGAEEGDLDLEKIQTLIREGGLPPAEMEMLHKMAGLFGGPTTGAAASSFEIGQLFQNMQREIFETLAGSAEASSGEPSEPEIEDDEFAPDDDSSKKS